MNKAFFAGTLLSLSLASVYAQDPVYLIYSDRVPYTETSKDGDVQGVIADPVKQVFRRAKIDYQWRNVPINRQLQIIENNQEKACLIGFFKNHQRALLGKFTRAIYQDGPTIAVVASDNSQLGDIKTIDDLLSNQKLILLNKSSYSYGAQVDKKIKQWDPTIELTTADNLHLFQMISYRRADYFFLTLDEAMQLVRRFELNPNAYRYLSFPELGPGNQRHIWCTRQVSDTTIEKLNKEIEKLTNK
ncbi:substrate-binding periplasmic protein [Undibacterium sp. Xuan67W]|uniref:substrate-binding periplasmic protein n=1 Tax=Undibacterium sp. Xuan67W TaxID=3413057 RepID=UPI003BF14B6E